MIYHYHPEPAFPERPAGAPDHLDWIKRRRIALASASAISSRLPDSDGRRVEYEGALHVDSHVLPDPSCPSHPGYG